MIAYYVSASKAVVDEMNVSFGAGGLLCDNISLVNRQPEPLILFKSPLCQDLLQSLMMFPHQYNGDL